MNMTTEPATFTHLMLNPGMNAVSCDICGAAIIDFGSARDAAGNAIVPPKSNRERHAEWHAKAGF